jgi:hypothetical protein
VVALRTLLLVAVVLVSRGIVVAQTAETGFLNRSVILDGVEYAYQIYVPREYKRSVAWPIIPGPAWSGRAR